MSAGRLAAAALVFSTFAMYGVIRTSKHHARVKMLNSLCADMREFGTRLALERMPLPQITARLAADGGECSTIWKTINEGLRDGNTFAAAYARAEELLYGNEEKAIMQELARSIGTSDAQSESQRLEFAYKRLDAVLQNLKARTDKSVRLTSSLSVLGGLAAALLLM